MIELSIDGVDAYLTMRPAEGKFTLLDVKTLNELTEAHREVQKSPALTLTIRGEGGCFAVGADLKTLIKYSGFTAKKFSMLGGELFNLMRRMPQVIIGEIDGYCMGGGMDFAAACDFRYAVNTSKFAHPGSKLGIITGFGGTQALGRIMKSAHMWQLFATGDMFDAEFMRDSGYLSGIFENSEEMQKKTEWLRSVIHNKKRTLIAHQKPLLSGV